MANTRIFTLFCYLLVFLSILQVCLAADASSSAEYTDDKTFRETVLDVSNTYRAQHNASKLEWNETLADAAEDWGKKCGFEHSGAGFGENLASGYANVTDAIIGWGEERRSYEFRGGSFHPTTGHFTQLVWKSTRSVGCSRHECNAGQSGGSGDAPGWYLVCEYWPAGNVIGAFERNVEKALPKEERASGQGQTDERVPEPEDECPQGAVCSAGMKVGGWGSVWMVVLVLVVGLLVG